MNLLTKIVPFALLIAGLAGCMTDKTEAVPQVRGGEAAFRVSVPGMKAPTTRALDAAKEKEITAIDLVIFSNTDKKIVEHHRIGASDIGVGTGGNDYQFTVKNIAEPQNIIVAVIANASAEVAAALAAVGSGASKTAFLMALEAGASAKWNTSADGYWTIPMYGEITVTGNIYDAVEQSVNLTRMLAKVDVVNNVAPTGTPADGDFELTAVHVVNRNRAGLIAPRWDAAGVPETTPATTPNLPAAPNMVVWAADGDQLTYNLLGAASLMDKIYLFESAALSGDNLETSDGLRLVFEGNYTSGGVTKHYYYPVDFTAPDGAYMPVLRNHRYLFTITEASGRGYDGLGEAVAAFGVMSNLRTSLVVVDESGIRHMVWNGEHFLGVSEKAFTVPVAGASDVALQIATDYADGWRASVENPADTWLSLGASSGSIADKTLTFSAASSDGWTVNSGVILLTAGRLELTISVTQEAYNIDVTGVPAALNKNGEDVTLDLEGYFPAINFRAVDATDNTKPASNVVFCNATGTPNVNGTSTVTLTAYPNGSGANRNVKFQYETSPGVWVDIDTVPQEWNGLYLPSAGIKAPSGILGVGAVTGKLTLDGSIEYPDGKAGETVFMVYFKWGSTVAISVGSDTNGDAFDKTHVAWLPEGFTGNITDDWGSIPYGDNASYPSSFPPQFNADGLGDPCKLVRSDNNPGKIFRMPSGNPYEQFINGGWVADYNGVPGNWSDYGVTKSQFYPAAGYLNGSTNGTSGQLKTHGNYWTTSQSGTNAYYLLIASTYSPVHNYTQFRTFGMPIRCIAEDAYIVAEPANQYLLDGTTLHSFKVKSNTQWAVRSVSDPDGILLDSDNQIASMIANQNGGNNTSPGDDFTFTLVEDPDASLFEKTFDVIFYDPTGKAADHTVTVMGIMVFWVGNYGYIPAFEDSGNVIYSEAAATCPDGYMLPTIEMVDAWKASPIPLPTAGYYWTSDRGSYGNTTYAVSFAIGTIYYDWFHANKCFNSNGSIQFIASTMRERIVLVHTIMDAVVGIGVNWYVNTDGFQYGKWTTLVGGDFLAPPNPLFPSPIINAYREGYTDLGGTTVSTATAYVRCVKHVITK